MRGSGPRGKALPRNITDYESLDFEKHREESFKY